MANVHVHVYPVPLYCFDHLFLSLVKRSDLHSIAEFPYEAKYEDDMSFSEGEKFVVEEEIDEYWLLARSLTSGKTGLIPREFVTAPTKDLGQHWAVHILCVCL